MKRVLFLLVAALALSLVAATPALAQEPPQAVIYADGVYTDALPPIWIDVDTDLEGQQIPDTYTFSVFMGWFAANRGLTLSAPTIMDTSVSVLRNGSLYRVITASEARRYWTGVLNPVPVDWRLTPFNPKMGTGVWGQEWFGPLGVLPVGHYDVTLTSTLRHTTTDLCGWEDGQRSPIMFKPGGPFGTFSYTTSFDVVVVD